jgi:hypothetical protein
MINFISIALLALFARFPASDVSVSPHKADYLIFGMYAGECDRHCATMYKVTDSSLFIDTTDSYFKGGLRFPSTRSSSPKFLLALQLLHTIPDRLFQTDTSVWGCPDCSDGGGYYVEFRSGGKVRKYQIDTDMPWEENSSIPRDLRVFTNRIGEVLVKMRDLK